MTAPLIQLRPGQQATFRHSARRLFKICRRQYGKSYELACNALDDMMEQVTDVIFCSASLRLGQENVRKESAVWTEVVTKIRAKAVERGLKLTTSADDEKGRLLDPDAVADLFEHQKLETRIHHSRTTYSRSIVVAPNPDTAVSWTGCLYLDEVGRMPEFKDLLEALLPIVSANPKFKLRGATTPPPDDAHHSYELLAPPPGLEFPVNPAGNFYRSTAGVLVHRVDAWDGAAGGVPLYDEETGEPLTPEQHRERSIDKEAWDRNYGCKFIRGGVAAVSLTSLFHAQAAGATARCLGINLTEAVEVPA